MSVCVLSNLSMSNRNDVSTKVGMYIRTYFHSDKAHRLVGK